MLTKIINTSGIDTSDSFVLSQLDIDLQQRIPRLKHRDKPQGTTHLSIVVHPGVARDGFNYHFFYGDLDENGKFRALGEPRILNNEELPYPSRNY